MQIEFSYTGDMFVDHHRQIFLSELDNTLTLLGEIDFIAGLPLSIDDDLFLNSLVNEINWGIIEFQKFYRLFKNKNIASINRRLESERCKAAPNRKVIISLENEITAINEKRMDEKLEGQQTWSLLKNERASRVFCNINSRAKKCEDLNQVKRDAGGWQPD